MSERSEHCLTLLIRHSVHCSFTYVHKRNKIKSHCTLCDYELACRKAKVFKVHEKIRKVSTVLKVIIFLEMGHFKSVTRNPHLYVCDPQACTIHFPGYFRYKFKQDCPHVESSKKLMIISFKSYKKEDNF